MLPSHVSATTKMRPVAGSITGVPVIPTVGSMSPHFSCVSGTAVATCCFHTSAPVAKSSAYTVSFSVATYTRDPYTSGEPKTGPSSEAVCHTCFGVTGVPASGSIPERCMSWRYVVQSGVAASAALGNAAPSSPETSSPQPSNVPMTAVSRRVRRGGSDCRTRDEPKN